MAGFFAGTTGGLSGAILGAVAVSTENFILLLVASYLTGIYMSAQGFYRFAAADTVPDEATEGFRAKAISFVTAGGLISALLGPQIVAALTGGPIATVDRFVPVYIAAVVLNLIGFALYPFLRIPRPARRASTDAPLRSRREILCDPMIVVPIIVAMVAYALMNLVMTATPLAVVGCGFTVADASNVVSAHVLAMYAPAFFTGYFITWFGVQRVVITGLVLLALAGGAALQGVTLGNFFTALILLGLGWNFAFIGATTMLTRAHDSREKGVVQGLNDTIVFGCVTLASLASGGLLNCSGGDIVAGWSAVNLAMLPFLTLAGGALIWLALRPKPLAGE
jgi:MFS family permease